jgi:hypothetical protein
MRNLKKSVALAVAVLALSAIAASSASAAEAQFTYSATGTLVGSAENHQTFTTNGGTVTCSNAATTGTIAKILFTQQHVTVKYGGPCTAFGFATVDISDATYLFTAKTGENVHVLNTISITPTFFGASMCTVSVGPQTLSTVDYANVGTTKVTVNATVAGIKYTTTGGGGSCGSVGTFSNGTYTGSSIIERSGGGTVQYDHGT